MNRDFKFRHANEIAGIFVIGASILFVMGIVFAGRSQGWFEPRFTLNIVFDTAEGSFGLQEGAPVLVRNTQAGRVGPILPTADGQMGSTLVIKDRFRPFITSDSVAKIKKKFGVAGDSYVEIVRGKGRIVTDEAFIEVQKDEELLETAQKMLADVQTNMMPILEQAEAIITSVASILDQVDTGKGVAGAVVGDSQLRDHITSTVSHIETITANAEKTVATVDALMSNEVATVLANVGRISTSGVGLMTNQVPQLTGKTLVLQGELTRTLAETRRLIEGVQRHWLFRKYVDQKPERVSLAAGVLGTDAEASDIPGERLQTLSDARAADDPQKIRQAAYHLAVVSLARGDVARANELLAEIAFAARLAGGTLDLDERLLSVEVLRRSGAYEDAVRAAEAVLEQTQGRKSRELHADAWLLLTGVYCDSGNADAAVAAFAEAERAVKRIDIHSPFLQAALLGIKAEVASVKGDIAQEAEAYALQADQLRQAGNFDGMSAAQQRTAALYATLGMSDSAATYYLRAASSMIARGQAAAAMGILKRAESHAQLTGDTLLINRIADVSKQIVEK